MDGAPYVGLKQGVGQHSSYKYCVPLSVQSSANTIGRFLIASIY